MRSCLLVLSLLLTPDTQALRLVSLSPALTESLAALGACSDVVATVPGAENSPFCPVALQWPLVAGRISVEAILAVHPDAVLVWPEGISREQITNLQKHHLTVLQFSVHDLNDVQTQMRRLGRLTGQVFQAQQLNQRQQKQSQELLHLYANQPWIRIFYPVWAQPLMTVAANHYIAQEFRLCHIRLLSPPTQVPAPQVGLEWVLVQHPQRIIVSDAMASVVNWRAFGLVVRTVSTAALERPSPHMLDGLASVCRQVRRP